MKLATFLPALLLLLPALAAPAVGQFPLQIPGSDIYVEAPPDRVFNLVMSGTGFNLQHWPGANDALVLESYLGEKVQFTVAVPATAETHTFHLHGHPWFAPDEGRFIDTRMLAPGDVISFTVTAGGIDQQPGAWMYHCHFASHAAAGMWGILLVYPFKARVLGLTATGLDVQLDHLGEPVDGAHLMLDVDGAAVPANATALGHGLYHVDAPIPATGVLRVVAHSPLWGESQLRVGLGGTPVPPLTAAAGAMDMGAM